MKEQIVSVLKYLNIYLPLKRFRDYLSYKFVSREDYYKNLDRLYSQFNLKDKLVFDIGAADDGVEPFLRQEAKVLALEPTERFYNRLKNRYNKKPNVIILKAAAGEIDSIKKINLCNSEYFSTFDKDQINFISSQKESKNLEWYGVSNVQMFKLDTLISKYGLPAFCKIDVEGYEPQVFNGLSKPIPLISFEFNTSFLDKAISCVKKIDTIGKYEYNYSHDFKEKLNLEWVDAKKMISLLRNFDSVHMKFGDIYARLKRIKHS